MSPTELWRKTGGGGRGVGGEGGGFLRKVHGDEKPSWGEGGRRRIEAALKPPSSHVCLTFLSGVECGWGRGRGGGEGEFRPFKMLRELTEGKRERENAGGANLTVSPLPHHPPTPRVNGTRLYARNSIEGFVRLQSFFL